MRIRSSHTHMYSAPTPGLTLHYSVSSGGQSGLYVHPLHLRTATRGCPARVEQQQPSNQLHRQSFGHAWPVRERAAEHEESTRPVVRNDVRVGRFEGESVFEQRRGIQCVLHVQRQGSPRCTSGECRHVRREKNRRWVRSGQDVPSKIRGASAPQKIGQVSARAASARAQREEEGKALLACV